MSFADMNRSEVATHLYAHGGHLAMARARFIAAASDYAMAIADAGPCAVPNFRRDKFVDQVVDTADGFLEDETQRDFGL